MSTWQLVINIAAEQPANSGAASASCTLHQIAIGDLVGPSTISDVLLGPIRPFIP